ncbi:MAG TPA: CoA-binding protein [Terriglobales bacterium]|nr:CoA-binding protein [Terriglobales bacterium]
MAGFIGAGLYTSAMENWQANIIEDAEQIRALLAQTRTIAVLGIKTEEQSDQPAFYVAEYLDSAGFEVIPVPVYYPEATAILGRKVYRKLSEIPGDVDLVDVFRRGSDVPGHLADILAKRPKAVWLQSGIRNDEVARRLAESGIKVVQNRCLMVEHRRLAGR